MTGVLAIGGKIGKGVRAEGILSMQRDTIAIAEITKTTIMGHLYYALKGRG